MNLRKRYWVLAASACITLSGLTSCKDYSSDLPFPDVYSQSLFVSSNNQIVYALDPVSGDRKWKFPVDGEVHATPVLYNKMVYVATAAGTLYKIDAQYGTMATSRNFGAAIEGTPIMRDGIMIVASGTKLYGIDPGTLADHSTTSTYDAGGIIMSSPTIHNIAGLSKSKIVFISTMGNNVIALYPDNIPTWTYTPVWTFTPADAGAFYSSPCVVNDSFAYVGNDNGKLYSIKTVDGTEKWSFTTAGQVRSSPIQIGGNVLVGSNDRNFYSVDSATGLLRWKVTTGDAIQSSPSVFNQYVYFGGYDRYMYCVDIIDGTIKWKQLTGGLIKASPLLYRGDVYFGSYDKNMYRLDAMDGSQKIFPVNINGQMATSPIIDSIGGAAVPSISGDYKY
jgi:outer membrane protein assembly factor BamB